MFSFGHEIPCPDDKAIRRFLWESHTFHDSEITEISFDRLARQVQIPLRNVWECYAYWDSCKGSWDERSAALDHNLDRFRYLLEFGGVEHFSMELDLDGLADVQRGRFLDSALLRRLQERPRWPRSRANKPLMHYRFESDGFIDIVFSSFKIRKIRGRASYAPTVADCSYDACLPPDGIAFYIEHCDPDSERLNRLVDAQKQGDVSALLRLARESLALTPDDHEASFYAAWILGFLGDESDLPAMKALYFSIDAHMQAHSLPINGRLPKRDVLDAIERIQWRSEHQST